MVLVEYRVAENGNVGIECPRCHKTIELPLKEAELLAWNPNETFVQDQFPQLTSGQREMLLSGLCEKCWNEIFESEEDEED
jgi:hypothetical protein